MQIKAEGLTLTLRTHMVWPHYVPLLPTYSPLHWLRPPPLAIPHTCQSCRTLALAVCSTTPTWLALPSSQALLKCYLREALPAVLTKSLYTPEHFISLLYCFLFIFIYFAYKSVL